MKGSFNGVCARGGFELSFEWENNSIRKVEVLSKSGKMCRIQCGNVKSVRVDGKKVRVKKSKDGDIEFPTQKGRLYTIEAK